jgi:alpha-L-rhamnosidase
MSYYIFLFLALYVVKTGAQTKAHEKSAFAVIDPTYNTVRPVPEPDVKTGAPWLYGDTELESWRLQLMRASSKKAARNGYFPGVFHQPVKRVTFRCPIPLSFSSQEKLVLRAIGDVVISSGGNKIYEGKNSEIGHIINLNKSFVKGKQVYIDLSTSAEPPALLIEEGPLATSNGKWQWNDNLSSGWIPACEYPQTKSGIAPHKAEIQEITLQPLVTEGKLFDFGRELMARVSFYCKGKPSVIVGESVTEASDTVVSNHEQTLSLTREANGRWISDFPLAFRYLQIIGEDPSEVQAHAQFYPVQYRGAFACSDERLTKIWMTAAYTHRLCENEFILDGIKRDRLPWIDNMNLSSAVESFTFSNPDILRRTIAVLGRAADQSDINNIVDYNSLWVISHDSYQQYFNDPEFLKREWPRIYAMVERLAARCDENGLLRWHPKSWIFIDWATFDKTMSEQIMWYWAQRAGVRLASRTGNKAVVAAWTKRTDELERYLIKYAWDKEKNGWDAPGTLAGPTRHAAVLSMVSGLTKPEKYGAVLKIIESKTGEPLNSPSMIYYEIQALVQMGKYNSAILRIREVWGAMLDRRATSFWEGYDENEKGDAAYMFYGRPYGKSMCHAWSAGPVVLLPEIIFGLKPIADGWKRFIVKPSLGLLEWASVTVPTIYGNIIVNINGNKMTLDVPAGTTAEWNGKTIIGPQTITGTQ